jgi:hypothetical protein
MLHQSRSSALSPAITQLVRETFIPRLLRVGWKAAGIYTYNPQKALNSSQVKAPIQRSSTPPLPSQNNLVTTPKGSRHIHQQATSIRKSSGQNQALFHVLHKVGQVGQAIGLLNAKNVAIEAHDAQLKAQIYTLSTKRRRSRAFYQTVTVNAGKQQQKIAEMSLILQPSRRRDRLFNQLQRLLGRSASSLPLRLTPSPAQALFHDAADTKDGSSILTDPLETLDLKEQHATCKRECGYERDNGTGMV